MADQVIGDIAEVVAGDDGIGELVERIGMGELDGIDQIVESNGRGELSRIGHPSTVD